MADISIKDAPLINNVSGAEKIPVSDGSGEPKAVTIDLITLKIPAAGTELGTVKTGGDVTITDGVITVNDKAPTSHASTATTYGLGTTSNYGHVKISNSDVDTVSTSNGVAAGMDHTHSKLAPKASPTFTGTPKAPTAAAGTNTTQLATTAFVNTTVNTEFSNRLPNISKEEFDKLINRDFYCPTLESLPTEFTKTYIDIDGKEREFVVGQECRVWNIDDFDIYKYLGEYLGHSIWKESKTTVVIELPHYIDLSTRDIHGTPIALTTANCYVVNSIGDYMFPAAYGAAIKNGITNNKAYSNKIDSDNVTYFVNYLDKQISDPYLESDTGELISDVELIMSDENDLITDIKIIIVNKVKYISFSLVKVPNTGANALISAKDKYNRIMWSWHIWVWKDDLTPVTITNATLLEYKILPVNLGSKWEVDYTEPTKIKNWYYQWGRPTPILLSLSYNNNEDANNYGVKETVYSTTPAATYGMGILNPNIFYCNKTSSHNWCNAKPYYNLWDSNNKSVGNYDVYVCKTVYDPCPVGYLIPNGNTFTSFSLTNTIGEFNLGYYFKRNTDDSQGIFFPATGYRGSISGKIIDNANLGSNWLSSIIDSGTGAYSLVFSQLEINPLESSKNNMYCIGLSVRPVLEEPRNKQYRTTIRINQYIQDPESMITRIEDFGGIEAIRANSHIYVGNINITGVMELRLVDDADSTKYLDGSIVDPTNKDIWMKLPLFYWKSVKLDTNYADISFVFGDPPTDQGWKCWNGNELIASYPIVSIAKPYSNYNNTYNTNSRSTLYNIISNRGLKYLSFKYINILGLLFYAYHNTTNINNIITSSGYVRMIDDLQSFWGLHYWNAKEFVDDVKYGGSYISTGNYKLHISYNSTSLYLHVKQMLLEDNAELFPLSLNGSETTGFCTKIGAFNSSSGGVAKYGYLGYECRPELSLTANMRCVYEGDYVII